MQSATQRKLQAAIDPSPAAPELIGAWCALSTLEAPGSLGARRGLRLTAERRGLEVNHRLLSAFGELHADLGAAERELDALCEASGSAVARLQTTRAATEVLISQTSLLKEQLRRTAQSARLAVALAEALHLSAEHEAVLNAPQGAPLSLDALLEALACVRLVGNRGRRLLGGSLEPLGLQITSQMAAYEERGYTALSRWVAAEAPRLPPNASREALARLRRGVCALGAKPRLLRVSLEEVAATRRDTHLRTFSHSLAVSQERDGGGGGVAAAAAALGGVLCDLSAAVKAERALLAALFEPEPEQPAAAAAAASGLQRAGFGALDPALDPALEDEAAAREGAGADAIDALALDRALALCFDRVAPLLRTHVEALLAAPMPLPLALRLALHLSSGAAAVRVGQRAPATAPATVPAMAGGAGGAEGGGGGGEEAPAALAEALSACAASVSDKFHSSLQAHIALSLRGVSRVPANLSAPQQFVSLTALLDELLEACASAAAEEAAAAAAGSGSATRSARDADADARGPAAHAPLSSRVHDEAERVLSAVTEPPLRHLASLASASRVSASGAGAPPQGVWLAATLSGVLGGARGGAETYGAAGGAVAALGPAESAVFLLNCVDALRSVVGAHSRVEATARAREQLDAHTAQLLGTLVRATADAFFAECHLALKLDALRTVAAQPQLELARMVGLEPLALGASMRAFYSLLFRGGELLPHAQLLASPALRASGTLAAPGPRQTTPPKPRHPGAVQRTALTLASTHRRIHELVSWPKSGYADVSRILLHSPDEVDTLLDVQGGSAAASAAEL